MGQGIAASGVPRSEIFVSFSELPCLFFPNEGIQITSKLWCTWHSRVEESLDQTLKNLGTDYLDCELSSSIQQERVIETWF